MVGWEEKCKRLVNCCFFRFISANENIINDCARSMNQSYGLGLSIAQTVVQAHRGKIWAESTNGVNTFFVQLPVL